MTRTLFLLSPLALVLGACSESPAEDAEPKAPTAREVDDPMGPARQREIMRHDHERGSGGAVQLEEESVFSP